MSFENIPLEMQQLAQWVIWEPSKVPFCARTGTPASVIDPRTWCTFEEAVAAFSNNNGRFAGIGFVFADGDPYCGIDLDDPYAVNADGSPKFTPEEQAGIVARHQKILKTFDTYTEASPSGTGMHIIIKACIPHGARRDAVEIYSSARFFTMTGNVFRNSSIAEYDDYANRMWKAMAAPKSEAGENGFVASLSQDHEDSAVYKMAARAKNGEKFVSLYNGNWQSDYPSQSEADLALIDIIAFYTQHVPQVVRMFRDSVLGKRDKAARADYVNRMVQKSFDRQIPLVDFDAILATFKPASPNTETIAPVDLWAKFDPPPLPTNLLPTIVERFARIRGDGIGADPAGLVMSALVVCAATIPDHVRLKVKPTDDWEESARLWGALIGNVSAKKTPVLNAATKPLNAIDRELSKKYQKELAEYGGLEVTDRKLKTKPVHFRKVIDDITIEAAGEILKESPNGVLCFQDELSGWIGSLDKYSGTGGNKDRGFWLKAYNGGYLTVDRIRRGSLAIDNASISILGGIQPDKIRELAGKSFDDGLLQRFIPIILRPSSVSKEEPTASVTGEYAALVNRLYQLAPTILHLDGEAQSIRKQLEERHHQLQALETINPKLASHIGKYDGIFARLCIVWHCIETAPLIGNLPTTISGDTARRVVAFLHEFLLPHAFSFYIGVLGLADDHDALASTAGYILARPELSELTFRDVKRGDTEMRALDRFAAQKILEKLEYLGWLFQIPGPRPSSPPRWQINPEVRRLFSERASSEAQRREQARQLIAETVGNRS